MLSFLPGPIAASIAIFLFILLTVMLSILFFVAMLVWLLLPIPMWRKKMLDMAFRIPSVWSEIIRFIMYLPGRVQWNVTGIEQLDKQHSYLLISNHQGFLDILVLQRVLDRRAPQLRYFMKKQLFWTPLIGQACWVMGYPFMQRFSKSYLKKHPEQRNRDLDTTRKACERFRGVPITLINYVEGTRVTPKKQHNQHSPFKYLLKPKAGGIAFILSAMQGQIDTILNTTITYPTRKHITWNFFKGKIPSINVHIETIKIPQDLYGDYQNDRQFRLHFQTWLNQLWQEKDEFIAQYSIENKYLEN